MKLMYTSKQNDYFILDNKYIARINGSFNFRHLEDLIKSFDLYPVFWEFYDNYNSKSIEVLGEFEYDDDLTEKFPEYLI